MKKTTNFIVILIPLLILVGISLFGNGRTEFEKVVELPEEEYFDIVFYENSMAHQKVHADLYVMFDCKKAFGIPLSCKNEKYVLYAEDPFNSVTTQIDTYKYTELDKDYIDALQSAYPNLNIPDEPQVSAWYSWGGKVLYVLIIAAVIAGLWFFIKND